MGEHISPTGSVKATLTAYEGFIIPCLESQVASSTILDNMRSTSLTSLIHSEDPVTVIIRSSEIVSYQNTSNQLERFLFRGAPYKRSSSMFSMLYRVCADKRSPVIARAVSKSASISYLPTTCHLNMRATSVWSSACQLEYLATSNKRQEPVAWEIHESSRLSSDLSLGTIGNSCYQEGAQQKASSFH